PVANAGTDVTICLKDTAILKASGSLNYLWNTKAETSSIKVSPAAETTYFVTVSDNIGCSSSDSVVVSVDNMKLNPGKSTDICLGKCCVLNSIATSNLDNKFIYLWSNNVTGSRDSVCPVLTTVYKVTATDSLGCSRNDSVKITVNKISVNAGDEKTICEKGCVTLTAVSNSTLNETFTYLWSDNSKNQSLKVCPDSSKYFSVKSSGNKSGCIANDSIKVNVSFISVNAGVDRTICKGDSVSLIATPKFNLNDKINFTWNNGDTISKIKVSPDKKTTYRVTVDDNWNCKNIDNVIINVQDIKINAGSDWTICRNQCYNIQTIAIPLLADTIKYLWNTGDTTKNIKVCPKDTTKYIVTITDNYGCSNTDSMILTVELIQVQPGDTLKICENHEAKLRVNTNIKNPIYHWYNLSGSNFNVYDPVIDSITGINEGNYYVYVTDGKCNSDTLFQNIKMIIPPSNPIVPKDTSICGKAEIYLKMNKLSGAVYSWSRPGEILVSDSSGLVIYNADVSDSGIYYARINTN
ncbi:MAG: hypothetical protein Q8880_13705, partial [Bacteroidota bacterium]|nr:hypothetical protein [Bacteroidota bacterium]